jgi:hypothetical protein
VEYNTMQIETIGAICSKTTHPTATALLEFALQVDAAEVVSTHAEQKNPIVRSSRMEASNTN